MISDKVLSIGLGVALAASLAGNVSQWLTTRDLRTERDTLDTAINDPKTGYVARLSACKANVQVLDRGISDQNASMAANAARGAAAVAEATRSVADAQVLTSKAQREASEILESRPNGVTECERLLEFDRLLLESVR